MEKLRKYAQITLAVVAVAAAAGAGLRYVARAGNPFGPHIVATPTSGPVGMRPFFEFPGFGGGREITVYLCATPEGDIQGCADLGQGSTGERLRANVIPNELPDGTPVEPGTYVLRAGPDGEGAYPQRGTFEIVPFEIAAKPTALSFARVQPSDLRIGEPREVARGAPCRAPLFLRDGRIAVGSVIVDPHTGVTVELDLVADELAWSPAGDKVAILTPDRKEIRLAAPDGSGATTTVREARGLLSSLSWSPDGDQLAFIAQNDPSTRGGPGPPTVRILNATTGEITSAGPGLNVAWSPRDDLLAVEMSGGRLEGSNQQGARAPLPDGRRPAWSPDGRFLTVVRSEGGLQQGWVVAVEGGGGAPLGGDNVCAMSFGPAGRSLAVVVENGEQTTLYLRSVDVPE